jgi:hypothetical protein
MDKVDRLWFKFILNNEEIKEKFIQQFKIYCNAVPLSEYNEVYIPKTGLISLVKYMSIHSENEEIFLPLVNEFKGKIINDEPKGIVSLNLYFAVKAIYNGEDSTFNH